jgi:hypothetical protein
MLAWREGQWRRNGRANPRLGPRRETSLDASGVARIGNIRTAAAFNEVGQNLRLKAQLRVVVRIAGDAVQQKRGKAGAAGAGILHVHRQVSQRAAHVPGRCAGERRAIVHGRFLQDKSVSWSVSFQGMSMIVRGAQLKEPLKSDENTMIIITMHFRLFVKRILKRVPRKHAWEASCPGRTKG